MKAGLVFVVFVVMLASAFPARVRRRTGAALPPTPLIGRFAREGRPQLGPVHRLSAPCPVPGPRVSGCISRQSPVDTAVVEGANGIWPRTGILQTSAS